MERPPFTEWLADPQAKPVKFVSRGDTLDWIAQGYGDDAINEILASIEEAAGTRPNGYIVRCRKDETIEGQWQHNAHYAMFSQGNYITVDMRFRTTSIHL